MKRIIYFALISLIVLAAGPAFAQEHDTDTLRVVETTIPFNDTNSVFIYMANADTLGGYSLRIRFDPNVIGIVTLPDNDSTVQATQVRGDFATFSAGTPEPGVVQMIAAFPNTYPGLDVGRGNTIQLQFYAQSSVTTTTQTTIVFEDASTDSNAYNWFAVWDGLSQYRPWRIPGTITIGGGTSNNAPTVTQVGSPVSASVGNLLSFNVNAQDPDSDPVTLTAFDLPSGASFSPSNPVTGSGGSVSGTFNWTPSSSQTGDYTVRFQANDDQSAFSGFMSVTIQVTEDGGAPIISPLSSPINTKQGNLVEFSVQATDPDGDFLTLEATNLPAGAEFTPSNPVSGTASVSGLFQWSPSFSQSGTYNIQFQAVDETNKSSGIVTVSINVEEVPLDELYTTSVEGQSPQGGVPGAVGVSIPINFVSIDDAYGVQFDLVYDPAVFTVTDIVPTERLSGFSVYEDVGDTPGRIKVVTFSLAGDPIGQTSSVIFNVIGDISATAAVGRYDLTFEDAWEAVSPDPNVSSQILATTNGHIFVDMLGDVNLDTEINVADVVSVVGKILGTYSFTSRQFGSANVITDADIDVYDLVGIINIIFGEPISPAPLNPGPDVLARVEFPFDVNVGSAGAYRLLADASVEIAGIQAEIIYDPLQVQLVPPEPGDPAAGLDMTYYDNGSGRMTVVMYYDPNDESTIIPIGENEIFGLKIEPGPAGIEGDLPEVDLRNVKLCTPDAAKIDVAGIDVPRNFELLQNYPNPFNPNTVIEFSLSASEEGGMIPTKLSVYNVLGQKLTTLIDEPLSPGRHQVIWSGDNEKGEKLSSGIYFYRLVAGTQSESKKMVLLK